MYIATILLGLIVLSAGYQCPLSQQFQVTAFSGTIKMEPQISNLGQDLLYKNTYTNALSTIPQVGLGISGYRSGSISQISITTHPHQIQRSYFVARVQSPATNRWGLLELNYLVTTKSDIEIGIAEGQNISYDDYGFFLVNYNQKTVIKDGIKIRPFISGVDINILPGGSLKLQYDSYRTDRNTNSLNFRFSSSTSYVKSLKLTVIIFNANAPSVLYLDDFFRHSSQRSSTSIDVEKGNMQALDIYFVGLTDFSLKQSNSIWINLSMNRYFQLAIEAQNVQSIGITYFIMSFLECGTCEGYPYLYNNVCSRSCPSGYQNQGGYCVPTQNCGSGYIRDPNTGRCIPQCGNNQVWTGSFCSCSNGFNLINGVCQRCAYNQYYNYLEGRCVSLCGPYADYNANENLCYCYSGYYVVDGVCNKCNDNTEIYNEQTQHCDSKFNQCGAGQEWTAFGCQCLPGYQSIPSLGICVFCNGNQIWNTQNRRCQCPAGQSWNIQLERCINIPRNCGTNEILANNLCVCRAGFNRIGGQCKQCPANSQYNPTYGFCQCINGYTYTNGACVIDTPTCQGQYERWFNGRCECLPGYVRYTQSQQCQPTCPQNMYYSTLTRICECNSGYVRRNDGKCYSESCPQGQRLNPQTYRCQSICDAAAGQYWDPSRNGCASCLPGYQWNYDRSQCIPATQYCQTGFIYIPILNICVPRCSSQISYEICLPDNRQCPSGYVYSPRSNTCHSQCTGQYETWNGQECVCEANYYFSSGICVPNTNPCNRNGQNNQKFENGQCVCIDLYVRRNGFCICQSQTFDTFGNCLPPTNQCNSYPNQVWNGTRCVCRQGYVQAAPNYCIPAQLCGTNEIRLNGVCVCANSYVRVNGVCSQNPCPSGLTWNETLNQCQRLCNPPRVWRNNRCQCPENYVQNGFGQCVQVLPTCSSTNNEMLVNGQCVCVDGHIRNSANQCVPICPQNQQWINGRCQIQCKEGQLWSGVVCYCKDGYERTADDRCLLKCPFNEKRSQTGGVCVCIDGYTRNSQQVCVPTPCQPGFRYDTFYKQCRPLCPSPHSYNPQTSSCICANGFEFFGGSCVPVCSPGEVRNSIGNCQTTCDTQTQVLINGQCRCIVGLYLVDGRCQKCPQYSRQVGGVCYCILTNAPIYSGTCPVVRDCPENSSWSANSNSCQCNRPYLWIYGQCRLPNSCLPNAIWNGIECVCVYGYFKQNGNCVPTQQQYYCPPNSFFNGVSCQCINGYFATTRGCQKCPFGRVWVGEGCGTQQTCTGGYVWHSDISMCIWGGFNCKANEYWDGSNCRCKAGYYWLSNSCQRCPANTFYDGKSCVSGLIDRRCDDPYQFWNGATCVCIPGFWLIDNKYCITCPSQMLWNGYYCELRQGLLRSTALTSGEQDSRKSNTVAVSFR